METQTHLTLKKYAESSLCMGSRLVRPPMMRLWLVLRLTTQLCSRGQGRSGPGLQSPASGLQISVEVRVTPDSPRPPRTIIEVKLMLTELAKALFLEQDKVFQYFRLRMSYKVCSEF